MSDDWGTPAWILDLIFDNRPYYDPCPLGKANGGLVAEWPTDRPVFINPPFSNPEPWVERASAHSGPVIMLLPADPSTAWWQLHSRNFRVTFLGQRIRFEGGKWPARFPVAVWRKP